MLRKCFSRFAVGVIASALVGCGGSGSGSGSNPAHGSPSVAVSTTSAGNILSIPSSGLSRTGLQDEPSDKVSVVFQGSNLQHNVTIKVSDQHDGGEELNMDDGTTCTLSAADQDPICHITVSATANDKDGQHDSLKITSNDPAAKIEPKVEEFTFSSMPAPVPPISGHSSMVRLVSDYPSCDSSTGELKNAIKFPLQAITDDSVDNLQLAPDDSSVKISFASTTCTSAKSCDPSLFAKYGQGTPLKVTCNNAKPGIYPFELTSNSTVKGKEHEILHVVVPDTTAHQYKISALLASGAKSDNSEMRVSVNGQPAWVYNADSVYSFPQPNQDYYVCGFNDNKYPAYYLSSTQCSVNLSQVHVDVSDFETKAQAGGDEYHSSVDLSRINANSRLELIRAAKHKVVVSTKVSGSSSFMPYYLHFTSDGSDYTYSFYITQPAQAVDIPVGTFQVWSNPISVEDSIATQTALVNTQSVSVVIALQHNSNHHHMVMPYLDVGAGGSSSVEGKYYGFQLMNWTTGQTNLIQHGTASGSDIVDSMPIDGVNWAFLQSYTLPASQDLRTGYAVPAASSAVLYAPIAGLRLSNMVPKVLDDVWAYEDEGHSIFVSQGGYSGVPIWAASSSSVDLIRYDLEKLIAQMHPRALDFDLEQGYESASYQKGTDALIDALQVIRSKYPDISFHWTLAVNAKGFPATATSDGGAIAELAKQQAFDPSRDVFNLMEMDWDALYTPDPKKALFNGQHFTDYRLKSLWDQQPQPQDNTFRLSANVFDENILASLYAAISQVKRDNPNIGYNNFGLTPMIGENDTYFSGGWWMHEKYDFGSLFTIDDANCLYSAMSGGQASSEPGNINFTCKTLAGMESSMRQISGSDIDITQQDLSNISFLSYWSLNRDRSYAAANAKDMLTSVDLTRVGSGTYPLDVQYSKSHNLFAAIFHQFDGVPSSDI